MRAIVFDAPGGTDVLRLEERPTPEPSEGQVRIRVHGSGLNRADLLQRRGHYPPPKGSPTDILGLEYAGVIDAVGTETSFRVGDSVMGIVGGGAYAEQIIVGADEVMRAPTGLSLRHAAAIPEAFMTAYDGLFNEGALKTGETVLIHAVGSGVGTAAVQLAKQAGARVIGTSRNADKLVKASPLGLTGGVVTESDWPDAVKKLAPEGIDVVIDLVGGKLVSSTLGLLRDRGRHVLIGLTGGTTVDLDLGRLLSKRIILRGTVLRTRPLAEKVRLARAVEEHLVPSFEAGTLKPVVDSFIAPAGIREAHQRLERNDTFGKIVIDWTKT
ncbi:MAG TPA: NAD(P)H-quinone oxidoreductase [Myxococcota bacterium]|nr:NAD(P)H-quinone oxidoreductase [Myxococcota bacterium]